MDLPTICEAQKTLDFRTFFKSADVSQMLYVHNRHLDSFSTRLADEILAFADAFKPFFQQDDPEFFTNLFKRGEITRKVEELKKQGVGSSAGMKAANGGGAAANQGQSSSWREVGEMLKFRHGLTPPTKNIRNIRYKKE